MLIPITQEVMFFASVVLVGSVLIVLALVLAIIALVKPQPQVPLLAVAIILITAALLSGTYWK